MRMRMRKGARKRESSACGFCVEQKLRRTVQEYHWHGRTAEEPAGICISISMLFLVHWAGVDRAGILIENLFELLALSVRLVQYVCLLFLLFLLLLEQVYSSKSRRKTGPPPFLLYPGHRGLFSGAPGFFFRCLFQMFVARCFTIWLGC